MHLQALNHPFLLLMIISHSNTYKNVCKCYIGHLVIYDRIMTLDIRKYASHLTKNMGCIYRPNSGILP
jgi:hypothetical protein